MPDVPVGVWEQIAVVIVFAFLLSGVGYVLVKMFTKAIADINVHYTTLLNNTNEQWQRYFDARSETSLMHSEAQTKNLEEIAHILRGLAADFELHDASVKTAMRALEISAWKKPKTGE